MKILQVNCVYKKGSTGKIVNDINSELKKHGVESVICYGRGNKCHEPHVHKICSEIYSKINNFISRITGFAYGGCFFSTLRLIRLIKKEHPDIVHLHCLNGHFLNVYKIITWLNACRIKTVLTLHAEFMHTANCAHAFDCEKWKTGCGHCLVYKQEMKSLFFDRSNQSWNKMKQAFDGFENLVVVSVSPWLKMRAVQSPFFEDKQNVVIMNGIDTEIFKYRQNLDIYRMLDISPKSKIILHVSACFSNEKKHPKGGWFVAELAKMMPEVIFVVAGRCEFCNDLPHNIRLLGAVQDQVYLSELYSLANASVITSRKETFSMPVAESLCCGTPVFGFFAGGPESIVPETNKEFFCEYGDLQGLLSLAKRCLDAEKNVDAETMSMCFSRKFMAYNYMQVYKTLLNG